MVVRLDISQFYLFCRGTLNCNTRFLVMDIVHVPKLVPCEHVSYVGRFVFLWWNRENIEVSYRNDFQ